MRIFRIAILCVLLTAIVAEISFARRRDKRPKREKVEITIRPLEFGIAAFLTLGYSTANTALGIDDIDFENVRYNDRLIYGGGLSFDLYLNQRYGLGVTYEALYKTTADAESSGVKGSAFSGSLMYNFRQMQRSIPYARFSCGYVSINWPQDDGPDQNFGDHMLMRLGLGLLMHTGAHTYTRFEIYYNLLAADDDRAVNAYGRYFGVQLGVGVPF